jgi:DNA repair exonuclease SbcCD nuclease subunit
VGKFLITADVHLDDRADHAYRWNVFKKLSRRAQRGDIDAIIIAGDLVDIKDRHPASFVDRLTAEVVDLPFKALCPVYILKGNHDYVDPSCPFFGYFDHLIDVHYVTETTVFDPEGPRPALLIPHTSWAVGADWRRRYSLKGPDDNTTWNTIICHQTFNGAKASNGTEMEGVPLKSVNTEACNGTRVLSGDIHVPQKIGNVTYIGSPHPVAFGDMFEPRIVTWDRDRQKLGTIRCAGLQRLMLHFDYDGETLTRRDNYELNDGDHAKVRLHAHPAFVGEWPTLRQGIVSELEAQGVRVFSSEFIALQDEQASSDIEAPLADMNDPLASYGEAFELDERIIEAGRKYL